MNKRVLLVEDDQNFGDVLKSYLEMNDFDITLATDGEMGWEKFNDGEYDLCIFDVMMPKKDGFTLAKEVREVNKKVPIIFLTAKTLKQDVLEGFKIGADDYITKPFDTEELLLRVNAILRRSADSEAPKPEQTEFVIGKYYFNYPLRILTYKGEEQTQEKLSPKESELLKMFCERINEILPRSEALVQIWHDDNLWNARSMDVFVTKLRKYLAKDESLEIVNIHGSGFRLIDKSSDVLY